MLKDITLGQYLPTNSAVHRLDPRVKIISAFAFIIAVFAARTFYSLAVVMLFTAYVTCMAKIKPSYLVKAIKPVVFLVVFTAVINVFLTDGKDVLVRFGFLKVTRTGLCSAAIMAFRIIILVCATSLLTFTTSPILLTDGIEKLLKPFSKIGLPAHELAMMMTIALRFIPTLLEETDKIIMAQKARGADFESGNVFRRAKALVPILVPLFISAFRRADELATAMECRCYRGGDNRTRLHELKFTKADGFAGAQMAVFLVLVAVLGVLGI